MSLLSAETTILMTMNKVVIARNLAETDTPRASRSGLPAETRLWNHGSGVYVLFVNTTLGCFNQGRLSV
jgi:hypothetical protein